ncbi:unnamed protein product [Caenorhabditis sp. 36 PRJEB53466]|nr:unnamed protein product [Caenorhabditis sp. 36 PRJEB53466]
MFAVLWPEMPPSNNLTAPFRIRDVRERVYFWQIIDWNRMILYVIGAACLLMSLSVCKKEKKMAPSVRQKTQFTSPTSNKSGDSSTDKSKQTSPTRETEKEASSNSKKPKDSRKTEEPPKEEKVKSVTKKNATPLEETATQTLGPISLPAEEPVNEAKKDEEGKRKEFKPPEKIQKADAKDPQYETLAEIDKMIFTLKQKEGE